MPFLQMNDNNNDNHHVMASSLFNHLLNAKAISCQLMSKTAWKYYSSTFSAVDFSLGVVLLGVDRLRVHSVLGSLPGL